MMTSQIRSIRALIAMGFLCAFVTGCQKSEEVSDFEVSLNVQDAPLIDAPATSCKTLLSGGGSADDIASLHMNIGQMTVKWKPPDNETRLKIVYVRVTLRSAGLKDDLPSVQISSQDLQCAMRGSYLGGEEFIVPGGTQTTVDPKTGVVTFLFKHDLLLGGLVSKDATKRTSFSGSTEILVYGMQIKEGATVVPVTGRASFRFNFLGIY